MGSSKENDTRTRISAAADAPTVRSDVSAAEAETQKIEARVYDPLRVCPECSLAWETTDQWCPSCGTAFERSRRESSTPTRVMSARPAGNPPLTRSARRAAAEQPPRQSGPPRRQAPPTEPGTSGSGAKGTLFALLAAAAIAAAFFAGQATRPSQAEVDRSIGVAVDTAKQSAVASYEKAFDELQARAATAIKEARAKGVAEGQANAQPQIDEQAESGRSIFDKVTDCVLNGQC